MSSEGENTDKTDVEKTGDNENLNKLMENESSNRFNKPWSKLDKGSKLNRINLFIKMEKVNNNLNVQQEKFLKVLLSNKLGTGELNKISDINYSFETCNIIEIKNLKYNEENKEYSFINQNIKKEKKSKSKSNIDRHFSKSKSPS